MFTRNPHIHLFVDNISFLNGKRFFLKDEALIIQGMFDGTFYCYFMHKQNPVAIPHESESKILFRGSKVMKRDVESGSVVLSRSYIILDNDYTNIIVKNHARGAIFVLHDTL